MLPFQSSHCSQRDSREKSSPGKRKAIPTQEGHRAWTGVISVPLCLPWNHLTRDFSSILIKRNFKSYFIFSFSHLFKVGWMQGRFISKETGRECWVFLAAAVRVRTASCSQLWGVLFLPAMTRAAAAPKPLSAQRWFVMGDLSQVGCPSCASVLPLQIKEKLCITVNTALLPSNVTLLSPARRARAVWQQLSHVIVTSLLSCDRAVFWQEKAVMPWRPGARQGLFSSRVKAAVNKRAGGPKSQVFCGAQYGFYSAVWGFSVTMPICGETQGHKWSCVTAA